MGIRLRRLEGCPDHSHTFIGQHLLERERQLLLVVTDQKLRSRAPAVSYLSRNFN